MAQLNLTDQAAQFAQIAPKIQSLKTAMNARKVVWDRLSTEKKKKWVASDKDPIMGLAWQSYQYLRDNFFGEVIDG